VNSNNDAGVRLFTTTPVLANFANGNGPPLAWDWVAGALYGLKIDGTVVPVGAAGAAAWGGITGTLSAQTDLQTALDGKQSAILGGSAVLSFCAAPGSGYTTATVTAAGITAASRVKVWVQGTTADHNAIEHVIIGGRMGLYAIPSAGSIEIHAETELRLSGDVAIIWEAA